MTNLPFVPKQDQDIPDSYSMIVHFNDGKKCEFDVASHRLVMESRMIEFVTKDDQWNWVPLIAVHRIEFDKRFSKIIAINNKRKAV